MSFVGNPTSNAAKAKALAKGGPLLIATDHVLAVMLPEALDRAAHAPHATIDMVDVQSALISGMIFDVGILESGVHFSVETARWEQLLQDLDNAAFTFEPVKGPMCEAWPTIKILLTEAVKQLPDDKRILKGVDVFFDGDSDDAATGGWYDWMSTSMLTLGDGGPEVLAQFQAFFPNANTTRETPARGESTSTSPSCKALPCNFARDLHIHFCTRVQTVETKIINWDL